jgi:hypothetical protein
MTLERQPNLCTLDGDEDVCNKIVCKKKITFRLKPKKNKMKDFEIVLVTAIVTIILTLLWCRHSKKAKDVVQTFGKKPTYYDIVYTHPEHKGLCYGIKNNLNAIATKRGVNVRFNDPTRLHYGNTMGGSRNSVFRILHGDTIFILKGSDLNMQCEGALCASKKNNPKDGAEYYKFDVNWGYNNSESAFQSLLAGGVID